MEKKLKIVLIILIMILVILIGFGGVYVKKLVSYNNVLPDFEFGMKLDGSRVTTLVLDENSEEVIRDEQGNVVDEIPEGADESKYTKEEIPANSEESKTSENYEKVKEIITGRLDALHVSNYDVRVNKENGNIFIELNNTDKTDTILSHLLVKGDFEISDKDDGTVLMTNDDIKNASVAYEQTTSGIRVYLSIQFNKEGTKKYEQISRDYVTVAEANDTEQEGQEGQEGQEETENTSNQKKISMKINGEEFLSTSFDNVASDGLLTISIGTPSTDSDQITEYIESAQYYASILSNEKMPLVYKVQSSDFIKSIYTNKTYQYVMFAVIAFMIVASILYIVVRYKKLGLLASIVYIATVAVLLLLVRYTKLEVNLDTLVCSIILILINTYINCKVLKEMSKDDTEEDRKGKIFKAYLKVIDLLIIALIPSVIFTYNASSAISSIGMILFWGVIGIALMNLLFTRTLLIKEANK